MVPTATEALQQMPSGVFLPPNAVRSSLRIVVDATEHTDAEIAGLVDGFARVQLKFPYVKPIFLISALNPGELTRAGFIYETVVPKSMWNSIGTGISYASTKNAASTKWQRSMRRSEWAQSDPEIQFRGGCTRDRDTVKNVRFILLAMAAATVIATAAIGFVWGTLAAIVTATAGLVAVALLVGYIQTRTLQIVTQRLAGLQKQNERTAAAVQSIHSSVRSSGGKAPASAVVFPKEVQRAFEDLTHASRSLTVPQAHFDQLLRTISANTVRTESALRDAVDDIRILCAEDDTGTRAGQTGGQADGRHSRAQHQLPGSLPS